MSMVGQRIDDDGAKQRQVQILEEPWGDAVIEEIERAGGVGVRLNASQRLTVQIDVELYLFLKRHSSGTPASRADDRKSLDTVIEHLGAAINVLKSSSPMKDGVLFMAHLRAKICPEDQIKVFESLYEILVERRKAMARPGRKADVHLDQLLEKLELVFLEAGGASTRISRPGEAPRLRE